MQEAEGLRHQTRRHDFFKRHGLLILCIGVQRTMAPRLDGDLGQLLAGQAELIVDITSTGSTLRANGLRSLDDGVILKSEANLVASRSAAWTEAQQATRAALLARLGAK